MKGSVILWYALIFIFQGLLSSYDITFREWRWWLIGLSFIAAYVLGGIER